MNSAAPVRLFFALWPEPGLQASFYAVGQKLYRHCGGSRTRRENIHMTLAFLGAVEAPRLGQVMAVAERIHLPAFTLVFSRLGWWRQNQAAWAAPVETPRTLADIVKALHRGLMQEGFKFDERRYLPHITLLRKANCPEGAVESYPIRWRVNEFALVRSTLHESGAHYAIVKRWTLTD